MRNKDPRRVGGQYFCGYWQKSYTVTAISDDECMTLTWEDGHTTQSRTCWEPRRDQVISQPPIYGILTCLESGLPSGFSHKVDDLETAEQSVAALTALAEIHRSGRTYEVHAMDESSRNWSLDRESAYIDTLRFERGFTSLVFRR